MGVKQKEAGWDVGLLWAEYRDWWDREVQPDNSDDSPGFRRLSEKPLAVADG
jgi:hypothetical protein